MTVAEGGRREDYWAGGQRRAGLAAHYAKPKDYEQIATAAGIPPAGSEANWAVSLRANVPTVPDDRHRRQRQEP